MICPKCNYQRTADNHAPDWQCPACGVVYAKFHQKTSPATTETQEPESKPKMDYGSVLGISALVCVILLGIKGFFAGGVSMINGLMLFPLFFFLMTVLSTLLCDEIYFWNKWELQFDRFDKETHPVMYKFLFVFSAIALAIFLGFFFLFD